MAEAQEVDLVAARTALDDVFAEVGRWRATQESVRKLIKQFIHRAIPWLQEHGRTVRPGYDSGAASVASSGTTDGSGS